MAEVKTNTIIDEAMDFIKRHYEDHFGDRFPFHNHLHALRVYKSISKLSDQEGIGREDKEILELAALFHDTGYYLGPDGHEEVSSRIAERFLQDKGYDRDKIDRVKGCIMATIPTNLPSDHMHQLMQDADMSQLGRKDYIELLNKLKEEWESTGSKFKKSGWWNMNVEFIKTHNFHTQAARDLYGKQKLVNYANVKAVADLYTKGKKKKKKKAKDTGNNAGKQVDSLAGLMDAKPAQMMFKTALRNHIDLTNIADNKANMMLSINALIVTITIPLVANINNLTLNILVPIGFLILTSIVSIIFAALVTRPIRMEGYTNISAVKEGRSNLFFFGNFYKMGLDEYKEGMTSVLKNEELLNSSIYRDLFYLGKALGKKYRLLRTCYMVFIIGMVLTGISFFAADLIF